MDLDLKGLIRKLDRTCTRALEGAAGLCVSRTHYEVTVEHMLAVLVEDANADVGPILDRIISGGRRRPARARHGRRDKLTHPGLTSGLGFQ